MICCSTQLVNNELDDVNSPTEQQYDFRQLLNELIQERSTTETVCRGRVGCSGLCDPNKKYSSSTTCGLSCSGGHVGPFGSATGKVGASGTCHKKSSFCRGGTYTFMRNTYTGRHFDCGTNRGVSCGPYGGCCVGYTQPNSTAKGFFCVKCHY
ncbi:unnamed protein product [Adineta steineri]|uniref:Uncharacterized protein n=1 Tax=Adineta steineri TaxID=433720 RepID=A0A818V5Q0_9BILA|nr:unnamed protein product [Adineta steineri]CAF1359768.1 unnamed protein product [Adineta steineri]CAF1403945.1 unnamed protein product [Adineta steineri]CAF3702213.1 unnamed protein product [Adineta steineri]CAF3760876.1 unnamed protein product [Adineta steineri]